MAIHIRRREFIVALPSAAAWPLAARAQQSAMPVVGYLSSHSPGTSAPLTGAFRQGLKDSGYVEGENVRIEYRWAEGQSDRLQVLTTELPSPTGGRDRSICKQCGASGQGGNHDDSHRLQRRR
jgi:putative ABC transport system substrate-binding protein